jgi:ABC-type uncharacterized transport system ATPase subunit
MDFTKHQVDDINTRTKEQCCIHCGELLYNGNITENQKGFVSGPVYVSGTYYTTVINPEADTAASCNDKKH